MLGARVRNRNQNFFLSGGSAPLTASRQLALKRLLTAMQTGRIVRKSPLRRRGFRKRAMKAAPQSLGSIRIWIRALSNSSSTPMQRIACSHIQRRWRGAMCRLSLEAMLEAIREATERALGNWGRLGAACVDRPLMCTRRADLHAEQHG